MIWALLAFAVVAVTVAFSESFNEAKISEEIEAAFKCHDNPGLAVSIVRDGKILLSRGYGVVSLFKETHVTNTTLFCIASVSKSFAATLLVKLLHENTNLTVDSHIRELLAHKLKMPDTFRTLETTFADIMAHRTGIPPNNYIRFDTNLTRDTLTERLHLLLSPKQFRVKYYYSNIMYGLVTRLAEVIGGKSWENLITEHLFQPLEMDSSTFASVVDFDRNDVAIGYAKNNGSYSRVHPEFSKRWSELAGSGSVMTSAADMAKWMNFHLHNGQKMQGQVVMSPEILAEVHKARFVIPASSDKEVRTPEFPITSSGEIYAHGFVRGFYRGYEHLSHSGSTQGYRAYVSLLPAQKIGVFMVMTGEDSRTTYRVAQVMNLLDRALELEPWLNVTTICSYPEPWRVKPKPSSSSTFKANLTFKHAIQQYEGSYYNSAYGYMQMNYNDTMKTFVMTYGWGKWQLHHLDVENQNSTETFYCQAIEATQLSLSPIYFVTTFKEGAVTIVGVKATAFEPQAPPIFHKAYIKTHLVSKAVIHDDSLLKMCYLILVLFTWLL